ncbi:MAG: TonB-dependent receptor [Alphaproteobacteria bacterium]|nr:TonB-dependent receptor [Alphaproteobacteria bacterium]
MSFKKMDVKTVRRCAVLAAFASLVVVGYAQAQNSTVPRSDTVVVTASRLSSTLSNTAVSTTVLTRRDIDALQPSDTVDLLRHLPGVHIDQPGGLGGVSSIYLRGGDPNYTQILIDGVQMNDPTNSRGGSFDVSSIDMESLERVEIIRGSQSAVRGADAISGTINFITRGGSDKPQYAATVAGGFSGYRRGSVEARGPLSPNAGLALSVALIDDGDAIEGSQFHNRVLSAKSDIFPTDESSLRLVARLSDNNSSNFPDDSGGPAFSVRRTSDTRYATEISAGLVFEQQLSDPMRVSVESSLYRHREVFSSRGVAPGVRSAFGIPVNSSESLYERGDVQASANLAVTGNFELVAGGGVLRETGASDSRLIIGGAPSDSRFALRRTTRSGFAEARWQVIPAWSLQAGMRVDSPDGFSTQTSMSVGSIYTLESWGTEWRANWAEGFKLPSFFALGNAIVGDPTLRLETSSSVETSVLQPVLNGQGEIGVSVFRTYFYDSVDFDSSINRLVNRNEAVAWGSELTGSWSFDEAFTLGGHVTFVDTDIRDDQDELRNRPKWRGGADLRWTGIKDVTLSGRALYVGRILDSSIPTGDRALSDHTRFDVAAGWRFAPGWELGLAVDNIFDNRYEEAVGFQAPGILPRMSLKVVF